MSDNLRLDQVEKVEQSASGKFDRVCKVTADTANRFEQLASGQMSWGSGSAAMDVVLARSGAAAAALTGSLTVSGAVTGTGGLKIPVAVGSTSVTNPNYGIVTLTSTAAGTFALTAPVAGCQLTLYALSIGSTSVPASVTAGSGVTFGAAGATLAFDITGKYAQLVGLSTAQWGVVAQSTAPPIQS